METALANTFLQPLKEIYLFFELLTIENRHGNMLSTDNSKRQIRLFDANHERLAIEIYTLLPVARLERRVSQVV